ncbi:hypothetical protein GN956_G4355 [Arapaima gigas]
MLICGATRTSVKWGGLRLPGQPSERFAVEKSELCFRSGTWKEERGARVGMARCGDEERGVASSAPPTPQTTEH